MPSLISTDVMWARVWYDGTKLWVKCIENNSGTPTETDWSGVTRVFDSDNFTIHGGQIGLAGLDYPDSTSGVSVDDFTLKTDRDANGSYETTEVVEGFTVDGSGYAQDTPTYSPAGNLTYDGLYQYAYDAWNRMVKVTKAYRDSGGTLQAGAAVQENSYDGMGRRIIKKVENSADLDCTYHEFYQGWQLVEERNGSNQTIKQYVWGTNYIDELVQTSLNDDPADGGEQVCETSYWACTDANYNVTGIVNSSGDLVERYEYTPYGQRTVFFSPGTNDPGCYAPTAMSRRWTVSSANQPYGRCEIGHQGLMHDERSGLVYNRDRMLNPMISIFMQRDPLGYVNGGDLYEYTRSSPTNLTDPWGRMIDLEGPSAVGVSLAFLIDWALNHSPHPSIEDTGPSSCPAGQQRYLKSEMDEIEYATILSAYFVDYGFLHDIPVLVSWQTEVFSIRKIRTWACCCSHKQIVNTGTIENTTITNHKREKTTSTIFTIDVDVWFKLGQRVTDYECVKRP